MRSFACAVVGALLFATSDANAAERPPPERSYGWQSLVVGYGGAALTVRGFWNGNPLMAGAGVITWTFGGTLVHAAHEHYYAAAASPFLKVGIPYALWSLGYYTNESRHDGEEAGAWLAIAGIILAPVVDAAIGRPSAEARPDPKTPTVTLAPSFGRDRTGLSVVGVF